MVQNVQNIYQYFVNVSSITNGVKVDQGVRIILSSKYISEYFLCKTLREREHQPSDVGFFHHSFVKSVRSKSSLMPSGGVWGGELNRGIQPLSSAQQAVETSLALN